MSMSKVLQVQSLHSAYQQQSILSGVDIELRQGELCSLLGPSGCGKTTLLRCIAGFQDISQGHISLSGKNISKLPPAQRGIGFVFQDYALFPHLTVTENIAYGLHKHTQIQKNKRVNELLDLINLQQCALRYPHELSGGQQQRIALARALAPKPQLLLLDEPFSNLDTELRKHLSLSVRDILKQAGLTAILVTHDQTEAFAFGDRVGILNNGQLEQFATPYTLYHQPETQFVAEFIGQGQLIASTVNDQQILTTIFGNIPNKQSLPRGEYQLLSRPDDWKISLEDSGVLVTITHKQFLGTQTLYKVNTADNCHLTIAAPSHEDFQPGDSVYIQPDFGHIITFPNQPKHI